MSSTCLSHCVVGAVVYFRFICALNFATKTIPFRSCLRNVDKICGSVPFLKIYLAGQKVQKVLGIETVPSHTISSLPVVLKLDMHRRASIISEEGLSGNFVIRAPTCSQKL